MNPINQLEDSARQGVEGGERQFAEPIPLGRAVLNALRSYGIRAYGGRERREGFPRPRPFAGARAEPAHEAEESPDMPGRCDGSREAEPVNSRAAPAVNAAVSRSEGALKDVVHPGRAGADGERW